MNNKHNNINEWGCDENEKVEITEYDRTNPLEDKSSVDALSVTIC